MESLSLCVAIPTLIIPTEEDVDLGSERSGLESVLPWVSYDISYNEE